MTHNDLKQVYYYNIEINMLEQELKKMRESGMQSPNIDGMPRSHKIGDSTGDKAVSLADMERIIENLQLRVMEKTKEIYEYITSIDDSSLRLIIKFRCIDLLTWSEVARKIGGGNTPDAVRKRYYRHFKEKK